ncbi:MAG: hypothetical protein KBA33_06110, partial [Cloacibacterium sp.]|nr:hypothetical protein [Cloacibacterium sp.]
MKVRFPFYINFLLYYFFSLIYIVSTSYFFLNESQCPSIRQDYTFFDNLSFVEAVIFYCLGALIETFISSFLVLMFLEQISFLKKNIIILLLISAIPFGLAYHICLNLILITYFMGFI